MCSTPWYDDIRLVILFWLHHVNGQAGDCCPSFFPVFQCYLNRFATWSRFPTPKLCVSWRGYQSCSISFCGCTVSLPQRPVRTYAPKPHQKDAVHPDISWKFIWFSFGNIWNLHSNSFRCIEKSDGQTWILGGKTLDTGEGVQQSWFVAPLQNSVCYDVSEPLLHICHSMQCDIYIWHNTMCVAMTAK